MAFMVGSIQAKLQLDSNGYTRGMLNAQSMNAVFGQSVTNFINNPLLGTIGIFQSLARATTRWIRQTAEAAESSQRLAVQTGLTTEMVQALRGEFELAGRPVTQADQAMRTFAIRLSQARENGGPVAEIFNRLGVSLNGIGSNQDRIEQTLNALAGFGSVAEAAALAAQIFGEEAGGALLETVQTGNGIDEIVEKMKDFGVVLRGDGTRGMAEFNTRLGEVDLVMKGLSQTVATNLVSGFLGGEDINPENIRQFAKEINQNLGPAVKDLGESLRTIATSLELINNLVSGDTAFQTWVSELFTPSPNSARGQALVERNLRQMGMNYGERFADTVADRIRSAIPMLGRDEPVAGR